MATTASVPKVALYPNDGTTSKPVIVTISDKSLTALSRVLAGKSFSSAAGGSGGAGSDGLTDAEGKNNWKKLIKGVAGIGILSTIMGKMLANSQVLNQYQAAMGKIFGAAMDMLLMPFLPLLNLLIVFMNKMLIWLVTSGVLEKIQKVTEQMAKYLEKIGNFFMSLFRAIIHGEWGEAARLIIEALKAVGREIVDAVKGAFHGDFTKAAALGGTVALGSGIIGKIMGVGFIRGAIWPFQKMAQLGWKGTGAGIRGIGRMFGMGGGAAAEEEMIIGAETATKAGRFARFGRFLKFGRLFGRAGAAAGEAAVGGEAAGAATLGGEAAAGTAAAAGTSLLGVGASALGLAAIGATIGWGLSKVTDKIFDKTGHGGSIWKPVTKGALIGAGAGAGAGAMIGSAFFGIGAVPGALIGGAIGAVVGGGIALASQLWKRHKSNQQQANQQEGAAGGAGKGAMVGGDMTNSYNTNSNNVINLNVVIQSDNPTSAMNEAVNAVERRSGWQLKGGTGSFAGIPLPFNNSSSWSGRLATIAGLGVIAANPVGSMALGGYLGYQAAKKIL